MQLALGVLGGLATYFGERPLDIRLFDPDPDFLNLSLRIGQSLLLIAQSTNRMAAYPELEIAMEATQRVIFMQKDAGSADRELPCKDQGRDLNEILGDIPVLCLVQPPVDSLTHIEILLDWPKPIDDHSRIQFAFQILRWANGEEYPLEFLKGEDARPLHQWLDAVQL